MAFPCDKILSITIVGLRRKIGVETKNPAAAKVPILRVSCKFFCGLTLIYVK